MVEFPPGEEQAVCAICGEEFEEYSPEFASKHANLVCEECDERAVTYEGERPEHGNEFLDREASYVNEDGERVIRMAPDVGDNPVFIDGEKCWRRYRFGGWITRRDDHDCDSVEKFHEEHRDDL